MCQVGWVWETVPPVKSTPHLPHPLPKQETGRGLRGTRQRGSGPTGRAAKAVGLAFPRGPERRGVLERSRNLSVSSSFPGDTLPWGFPSILHGGGPPLCSDDSTHHLGCGADGPARLSTRNTSSLLVSVAKHPAWPCGTMTPALLTARGNMGRDGKSFGSVAGGAAVVSVAAQGPESSPGVVTDPPRCQAPLRLKCQRLSRHLAKFICHLGSYVLNISL